MSTNDVICGAMNMDYDVMGVKVSTKWRKYTKTCVNKYVLMFSYKKPTLKHTFSCILSN